MMHRYSPARISESQWAALAPTRPLKQRMWCLWTISPPKSQRRCAFQKTLRIVHQNIVFSLAVKGLMLLLGGIGREPICRLRFCRRGCYGSGRSQCDPCAAHKGTGIEPAAKQTGTGLSLWPAPVCWYNQNQNRNSRSGFLQSGCPLCSVSVLKSISRRQWSHGKSAPRAVGK